MCTGKWGIFYLLFPVTELYNEKQAECWGGCEMLANFTGHSAVMSCDFIGTKWLVHVAICIGGNLLIDSALLGDHVRPIWNYRLIDSPTTELLAPPSVLTKPSQTNEVNHGLLSDTNSRLVPFLRYHSFKIRQCQYGISHRRTPFLTQLLSIRIS